MTSILQKSEGGNWYAETVDWRDNDPHSILKIGVSKKALNNRSKRGQSWAVGQLHNVVSTGLIRVDHIFQGLLRPMSVNGNQNADSEKLIFTWAASKDAKANFETRKVEEFAAPIGCVFFTLVSPNTDTVNYPEMFGWLEHWGWLDAHETVTGAPVDYDSRYGKRLWSKR